MAEEKKYKPANIAFAMGRIDVIERALLAYKETLIVDFRESDTTEEELSTFANDLSKIDGILGAIAKGRARIAAR